MVGVDVGMAVGVGVEEGMGVLVGVDVDVAICGCVEGGVGVWVGVGEAGVLVGVAQPASKEIENRNQNISRNGLRITIPPF